MLFAAAVLPIFCVRVPAMVDYPNHLARMFVIARDGTTAPQPFYHVAWALYPNLAMDLVVPFVGRFIDIEPATRLFLLTGDGLIVSGAVILERVIKRRFDFAGFVAVLALYSLPFAWGFLNFEFALGLALWGIAGWLVFGERAPVRRIGLHALMVALLFVAHLFALGIYGFVLGVHELWYARIRGWPVRRIVGRALVLGLPVLPLLLAMVLTGGAIGQDGTAWVFLAKPLWICAVFNGYSLITSITTGAVLLLTVVVMRRWCAFGFEASGAWIAVGLALLYCAMPFRLFDTAFVDVRVAAAALLLVPAFMTISYPNRRFHSVPLMVLACLIGLNLSVVLTTWVSYDGDYRAMIEVFHHLKKGSRLLVGDSGEAADPPMTDLTTYPMYNAPTLAVHFADAFVPTLFTSVGKQVIVVDKAERDFAVPYGGPVPRQVLVSIAEGRVPPGTPGFVRSWPQDYDYLCLVGDPVPNPLPQRLTRVASGLRFTLYRISGHED